MAKPKHGDRVTFTHRMYRISHPMVSTGKSWEPMKSPGEGIFLGWRTKQDGRTRYEQIDEGYAAYFEPSGYVRVAMVSVGPTTNPIYVSPEGLEVMSHDIT